MTCSVIIVALVLAAGVVATITELIACLGRCRDRRFEHAILPVWHMHTTQNDPKHLLLIPVIAYETWTGLDLLQLHLGNNGSKICKYACRYGGEIFIEYKDWEV